MALNGVEVGQEKKSREKDVFQSLKTFSTMLRDIDDRPTSRLAWIWTQ